MEKYVIMETKGGKGWLVVAFIVFLLAMSYFAYRSYRKYHPKQVITIEQEVPELEIEEVEK